MRATNWSGNRWIRSRSVRDGTRT